MIRLPSFLCVVGLSGIALALSACNHQQSGDHASAPGSGNHSMSIQKEDFGKTGDGQTVDRYTLTNKNGMVAKIMTYGAIVTELHVPDRNGKDADVVLGFDNLKQYLDGHPYFGAIAGRYANRIAKGTFTLEGKEYPSQSTTRPTHCTAAKSALTSTSGRPSPPRPLMAPRSCSPTSVLTWKKVSPEPSPPT